jgi:hypothetical protein
MESQRERKENACGEERGEMNTKQNDEKKTQETQN